MNSAMECRNLQVGYPGSLRTGTAGNRYSFLLQDVSFSLPRGLITGLVGNMGSGKTSLIMALAGQVKWQKGEVVFHGHPTDGHEWSYARDEKSIRRMVSFVFEQMKCPKSCTGKEMAATVKKLEPWFDEAYCMELLNRLSVAEGKRFGDLSRGMKKRMQLALMMARRPEILVLDEPCAEVDPPGRKQILELLQEFMEDETHAILYSTNMTDDIDRIADRILILDSGRMVFQGGLDACKEAYASPGSPFPTVEELMLALHTVTHS